MIESHNQPVELSSIPELAAYLSKISPKRIAIDGPPGVGKTTLAQQLAPRLDVRCVHLDDFLEPNQGGFLEFLDFNKLASSLQQTPLIVEGVCLLAALERACVGPDVLVYVRPSPAYWKSICHDDLFCEAAIYLHQYRPDAIAHLVYDPPHLQQMDDHE